MAQKIIIKKMNTSKGIVMHTVLIIMLIVVILTTSILFIIENQTLIVSKSSSGEDALHIAEAGYNYYLWQLNDDTQFYRIGIDKDEKLIPETYYTVDDNPLWDKFPKDYKPVSYISVGKTVGYYKLHIIPPNIDEPVVTIESTGWTVENPDNKKTIQVKVHKKLFTNYVSFSGDMTGVDGEVYWGDGEQIRGPFYTNGTLRTKGSPIFHGPVYYGDKWKKEGYGYPVFKMGTPQKVKPMVFPSTNSELANWGKSVNGGYSYNGRTCILLNNDMLRIRNVNTNDDNIVDLPLPDSSVIYIKGDLYISGVLDGRLTILVEGNIYITRWDPTNFSFSDTTYTGGIKYANQNIPKLNDEHPSNPSDDILGLVSNGIIYVHSYGWPKKGGGLRNIWDTNSKKNITINAALFGYSSTSYFTVQRYSNLNNMGYIYFTGSHIFSKAGATYTTSFLGSVCGYKEDNTFDYRMRYDAPPKFLEPEDSGWEVRSWSLITSE